MKYLLPLLLCSSAAWAMTRDTRWDPSRMLPDAPAVPVPAAVRADPPWLTERLAEACEQEAPADPAALGERAAICDPPHAEPFDDPHAGLFDGDPHAGLFDDAHAAPFDDPHAGLFDDAHAAPFDDPHAGLFDDDPHASLASAAGTVEGPQAPLPRSGAANGRNIAELFARPAELAGSLVRVRGQVVKRTDGILGKTYLHLRDGTGTADQGNHDLTLTTTEAFDLGEVVEVEGRVLVDQDLGFGYRYPVLLEASTRIVAQ